MKKVISILIILCSFGCSKTPLSQPKPADEQVTFVFNYYQKGSAKMVCIYDQKADTVTVTTYSKTVIKTAHKSIYVHSEILVNSQGQLIGTSSTADSLWVSISINGILQKTSGKAGKNDYYYENTNADYKW